MPEDADSAQDPGTRGVTILGSAGSPWPVSGCGCVACRTAPHPGQAPSALRVGDVTVRAGAITTADGTEHLAAGARRGAGGVRLAALPGAAGAPPVIVAGRQDGGQDGGAVRTLLWAEGPGDLPHETVDALAGAGLDVVALDLRDDAGRPDPRRLAHALARLRRAGAVAPGADVVALGLTHDLHPGVLAERLARWGARAAPDGTPLPASRPSAPAAPAPARTLVLGPASSGKSALAEDLLAAEPDVVYAATGPRPGPGDEAWSRRVAAHRERRPPWWSTRETTDLVALLADPGPPLLVDALGTWVAATMDAARAWDDAPGWREEVEGAVDAVVTAWRQSRRRVVAVGEEVGWGVVPADRGTAAFREVLGGLSQRLAAQSEQVLLAVAGRTLVLGPAS